MKDCEVYEYHDKELEDEDIKKTALGAAGLLGCIVVWIPLLYAIGGAL